MGDLTINSERDAEAARPSLAFDAQGRLRAGILVEHCVRFGGKVVFSGWVVDAAGDNTGLVIRGDAIDAGAPQALLRYEGPDVDSASGLAPGAASGFIAIVTLSPGATGKSYFFDVKLAAATAIGQRVELTTSADAQALNRFAASVQNKLGFLLTNMMDDAAAAQALTPLVRDAKRPSLHAAGQFDAARCVPDLGGLVIGWAIGLPHVRLLLLGDDGKTRSLDDAVRWQRSDIISEHSHDFGQFSATAGFLIRCAGSLRVGATLLLIAIDGDALATIAETEWTLAPQDAISFARWSFEVAAPATTWAARMEKHDGELLEQLRSRDIAYRKSRTATSTRFGRQIDHPRVSIIVPIRSRFDTIHNQLIEMEDDAGIVSEAEFIFVVDDPEAYALLMREALHLEKYYDIAFTVVGGFELGGLAAAMNLGASVSRASLLMFLAANVIPTGPGWLAKMQTALEENETLGAIGSRLMHPSGAIRHDGVSLTWDADIAGFVPRPIGDGAAPMAMMPGAFRQCDAVSAACLFTTRPLFEEAGGFDESYALPMFIAADFCLRLKNVGYGVACVQDTSIVSLDMPSDWLSGTESFLTGCRHLSAHKLQLTWPHLLPSQPRTTHESTDHLPSAS